MTFKINYCIRNEKEKTPDEYYIIEYEDENLTKEIKRTKILKQESLNFIKDEVI